jgi:ABC-type transporter Mla subunit MlaD
MTSLDSPEVSDDEALDAVDAQTQQLTALFTNIQTTVDDQIATIDRIDRGLEATTEALHRVGEGLDQVGAILRRNLEISRKCVAMAERIEAQLPAFLERHRQAELESTHRPEARARFFMRANVKFVERIWRMFA